jgi:hypothetical protein
MSTIRYADITDPKVVNKPAGDLSKLPLRDTWVINNNNRMALIFDQVSPVRHFKRGEAREDENGEDLPYATYNPSPEEDPDVTDTDDEEKPLKPYHPPFEK